MARLPVVGSDEGQWGALLNEFLRVSHHEDGTLQGIIEVVNVADYGNDTAALPAALADVGGDGKTLLIPTQINVTADVTIPANVTLHIPQGGVLDTGYSILDGAHQWNQSAGGPNEWYLDVGPPGLMGGKPAEVVEHKPGYTRPMKEGTVGQLARGEWAWGKHVADGLGYDTVYLRLSDDADPITKPAGYLDAQYLITINGPLDAGRYQVFDDSWSIRFGSGHANVYMDWFGSDDVAFRQAYDATPNYARLVLSNKIYEFKKGVTVGSVNPLRRVSVWMEGSAASGRINYRPTDPNAMPAITIAYAQDCEFRLNVDYPDATPPWSSGQVGVEIRDMINCTVHIDNISRYEKGLYLHCNYSDYGGSITNNRFYINRLHGNKIALDMYAEGINSYIIGNHFHAGRFTCPGNVFLFSVGLEFQSDLEQGILSEEFRQEFEDHGISLSENLTITTEVEGSKWWINDTDQGQTYIVKKEDETLNIYGDVNTTADRYGVKMNADHPNSAIGDNIFYSPMFGVVTPKLENPLRGADAYVWEVKGRCRWNRMVHGYYEKMDYIVHQLGEASQNIAHGHIDGAGSKMPADYLKTDTGALYPGTNIIDWTDLSNMPTGSGGLVELLNHGAVHSRIVVSNRAAETSYMVPGYAWASASTAALNYEGAYDFHYKDHLSLSTTALGIAIDTEIVKDFWLSFGGPDLPGGNTADWIVIAYDANGGVLKGTDGNGNQYITGSSGHTNTPFYVKSATTSYGGSYYLEAHYGMGNIHVHDAAKKIWVGLAARVGGNRIKVRSMSIKIAGNQAPPFLHPGYSETSYGRFPGVELVCKNAPQGGDLSNGDRVWDIDPVAGAAPGWVVVGRVTTTVPNGASSGASSLTVATGDGADIKKGDVLGVLVTVSLGKRWHWTSVNGHPNGDVVSLNHNLPAVVDPGAKVITYRTKAMASITA